MICLAAKMIGYFLTKKDVTTGIAKINLSVIRLRHTGWNNNQF